MSGPRRLFRHVDPDGVSVEVLALPGRSHAVVLHAHDDGENAMANLPRAQVIELHEALGRWLDR